MTREEAQNLMMEWLIKGETGVIIHGNRIYQSWGGTVELVDGEWREVFGVPYVAPARKS